MGSTAAQLFLGDTNRTICETPMNMASSRSHCMFMLHIEARKVQRSVPLQTSTTASRCTLRRCK